MKHVLKQALGDVLPASIRERPDKMGFPVPFQDWLSSSGPVRDFVFDMLSSDAASGRTLIDNHKVLSGMANEPRYGRKIWGLLCLELWQRSFHDRESAFKALAEKEVLA
jgi:asparagine synthase (glutamine-hydrolysing)